MTNTQKEQIVKLSNKRLGYNAIAAKLSLTKDQVASFCRRNGLAGFRSRRNVEYGDDFCRNCGQLLVQDHGKKKRKFCSAECRIAWWSANPDKVNRRQESIYSFACAHCGKSFTAYGNAGRKYCSHACYIADRFAHEK